MIRRIVIFLIRRKLGLKELEGFKFTNQRCKNDWYYFTKWAVWKVTSTEPIPEPSSVSLNWLLDPDCKIEKIGVRADKCL